MLKKCLKHEWKACWKNMALLNGAATVSYTHLTLPTT